MKEEHQTATYVQRNQWCSTKTKSRKEISFWPNMLWCLIYDMDEKISPNFSVATHCCDVSGGLWHFCVRGVCAPSVEAHKGMQKDCKVKLVAALGDAPQPSVIITTGLCLHLYVLAQPSGRQQREDVIIARAPRHRPCHQSHLAGACKLAVQSGCACLSSCF